MNKRLEDAIGVIERLPDADQERAAEMLQQFAANSTTPYVLDDEERAAIRRGLEEARRGEFASDEEIAELRRPWR